MDSEYSGQPLSGHEGVRRLRNSNGEDMPDILVAPCLQRTQSSPMGNDERAHPNGREASDSRGWLSNRWWRGPSGSNMQNNNRLEAIQAGPTTRCGPRDRFYKMDHPKRGKCIIFNHSHFHQSQDLVQRTGSEADVNIIKSTFIDFGFTVVEHHDLQYGAIMDKLRIMADEDHSQEDCLVVFVLTHGSQNLLHAYDVTYKPSQLWHYFTADKCSTLAGKPKMFFIQACRGIQYDNGTKLRVSRTQVDGPLKDDNIYSIPNQADILTVFSTFEASKENVGILKVTLKYISLGYYAWRNSQKGSCFIQALCRVFQENWETEDVLSMLTDVNREVGVFYESRSKDPGQDQKKQVAHVCHTLMRKIHLGREGQRQSTLV